MIACDNASEYCLILIHWKYFRSGNIHRITDATICTSSISVYKRHGTHTAGL